MNKSAATLLVVLCLIVVASSVHAQQAFDGVLGLSPVGEHSCVAVALPVIAGQPIAGLSWIHNDQSVPFPKLLIMEGRVGSPPDLTQTSLVLEEITGASLAWGEVTFGSPIVSSSDVIYAVFQLPAFTEKTADGLGGGPGIGYVHEKGTGAAYVSVDGTSWTRLHPEFSMSVKITQTLGKGAGGAQTLSDLRATCPAGWWDEIGQDPAAKEDMGSKDEAPAVSAQNPLVVIPNPFNPRAKVQFYVRTSGTVSVEVFDLRGRRVKSLLQGAFSQGPHEVVWEGIDDHGAAVASGVYVIQLQTPEGTQQTRAALVR